MFILAAMGVGSKGYKSMYELIRNSGYEPMILKNVIDINDTMPLFMAEKIDCVNQNESIAILGLSLEFQHRMMLETCIGKIIRLLLDSGYSNLVHDQLPIRS